MVSQCCFNVMNYDIGSIAWNKLCLQIPCNYKSGIKLPCSQIISHNVLAYIYSYINSVHASWNDDQSNNFHKGKMAIDRFGTKYW